MTNILRAERAIRKAIVNIIVIEWLKLKWSFFKKIEKKDAIKAAFQWYMRLRFFNKLYIPKNNSVAAT